MFVVCSLSSIGVKVIVTTVKIFKDTTVIFAMKMRIQFRSNMRTSNFCFEFIFLIYTLTVFS